MFDLSKNFLTSQCARGMALFCFDDGLYRFVNRVSNGLVSLAIGCTLTPTLFLSLGKVKAFKASCILALGHRRPESIPIDLACTVLY